MRQTYWARKHGTIFDIQKFKWVVFSPREDDISIKITSRERNLQPVYKTKLLGITMKSRLKLKEHNPEVIDKQLKRAISFHNSQKQAGSLKNPLQNTNNSNGAHCNRLWRSHMPPTSYIHWLWGQTQPNWPCGDQKGTWCIKINTFRVLISWSEPNGPLGTPWWQYSALYGNRDDLPNFFFFLDAYVQ